MKYTSAWLPILLMALITPFTPELDLALSNYFYTLGQGQFISNTLTQLVYSYAIFPADIVAGGALCIAIASFFFNPLLKWRRPAMVLVLTLAVGAGLIVHALLKDHWGRPRPKQITEFGGTQNFRPYYQPNFSNWPEPSKSFSCGHCTTGFFFFALALIGKRLKNKKLTILGWLLAITLGTLLSIVRIAQGGHFLSDALISALIMWETALFFDWLLLDRKSS